jgi:hypothetical protein
VVEGCTRGGRLHENLVVEGCTFWTEDQFVVTSSSGIRKRDTRVTEIVTRESQKDKPVKWGCVQVRELWSPKEETHVRAGHNWLLKFGKVPGSMNCVEKEFILVLDHIRCDLIAQRVSGETPGGIFT